MNNNYYNLFINVLKFSSFSEQLIDILTIWRGIPVTMLKDIILFFYIAVPLQTVNRKCLTFSLNRFMFNQVLLFKF